jgi:hypothetical protein
MGERTRLSVAAERLQRAAPLTDIHVHTSLKAWLFGRNLWRHLHSGATLDPFSSRSDFEVLKRGGSNLGRASRARGPTAPPPRLTLGG